MNNTVKRIFVEKKLGFNLEAKALLNDLHENLGLNEILNVRIVNRYDIEGLDGELLEKAKTLIFSEPPVDDVYEKLEFANNWHVFAVELLPGQYDQREDFAAQCVQLITQKEKPIIETAKVYILEGNLSKNILNIIKKYIINPVEAREAALEIPVNLSSEYDKPANVEKLIKFNDYSKQELKEFLNKNGLAMSLDDLVFCQEYFRKEGRVPTITEIKVLDTYWSDHCRHTTFMTEIRDLEISPSLYTNPIQESFDDYLMDREFVYGKNTTRPITLMDMAILGVKKLKKEGKLNDLDVSEEINACSIVIPVDVNGKKEEWLLMFKNETHNHPTEIEPFGGAATCLGGAIRDPLSGRSYVYQAMRVTGAANPLTPFNDTLEGKLSQRKITIGAASGYSSYGNQIGLATGQVHEFYNDNFVAKRMEVGAVIGAAPKENVIRERPQTGDIVVLLGGKTGRDGCGGATGSSKEHTLDSLAQCGAEVQKGNAPTERKIQRLFRNPKVTTLIKRCNDFGAGGVSVAVGELTDGLNINLDKVPKKYDGLDGTELAISESQERMAVVIEPQNLDKFMNYSKEENLESTVIATVTDKARLEMYWRGEKIVDLSREFLDSNGISQTTNAIISINEKESAFTTIELEKEELDNIEKAWYKNLKNLNVCSQKGLAERFDSTIGRGTVLMPFGGKNQITPTEGMVAKIPVLHGDTTTASIMASGYNPRVACWSPFHGGMYAIVESVARAVALGTDPEKVRLTLQEYFPKLNDESLWGQPVSAVLGAYKALNELELPAIGGKDSMSGTFLDKKVPPSLVSFAVGIANVNEVVSSEFKHAGNAVVFISTPRNNNEIFDFKTFRKNTKKIHQLIKEHKVLSSSVVKEGGIAANISTMCLGNNIGFEFIRPFKNVESLFTLQPGGFILEIDDSNMDLKAVFGEIEFTYLGSTIEQEAILLNDTTLNLKNVFEAYMTTLNDVFPYKVPVVNNEEKENIIIPETEISLPFTASYNIAKPRVLIPVFPGTNCEYDSAKAFEDVGGKPEILVVKNLTPEAINESVEQMVKSIAQSQIIMLPGGFSAGDEPDGSGKFIATMFRNSKIQEAINEFLENRDGLMIGICNGFQALIKLGLLPYGEICDMKEDSPTLTYNNIGRHVSQMVQTKIVSNNSPWLNCVETGDVHSIPVSHGEGRFVAKQEEIERLIKNGQIITQYVDQKGNPTLESPYNPNGSAYAVEGICSQDGRILGKMGHSERYNDGLFQNIKGDKNQKIFLSGVEYFK